MSKLIDISLLKPDCNWDNTISQFTAYSQEQINSATIADVMPIVHAKWQVDFDDMGWLSNKCSNCGYTKHTDVQVSIGWNYCPKCGARMDLKEIKNDNK